MDDEPAVRAITARLLRQMGYRVFEAGDGDAALAVCAEQQVDALLVTDVAVLPGQPVLLTSQPAAGAPAHLPSAVHLRATRELLAAEGRPLSGAAFLGKPFTREALALRIRDLLDARV
ncbi:MAG: hypothetical protein U0838_10365 [Chloroflexota bacterium]